MNHDKQTLAVQPYLFFDGRCDEAIEFYKKALGAQVQMVMRFKESPEKEMCMPGIDPNKIMHAEIRIGGSTILVSDGRCSGKTSFDGFSLSLIAANEGDAERLFNALADGGQVQMPLGPTFFSPRFGMVADQFGVSWMIYVTPRQ